MRINDTDRMSGLALILGSLAGIVTMTLHPSPTNLDQIVKSMTLITATHTLALIGIPLQMCGFLGLTRRLIADKVLAPAGMAVFAFGTAAVLCAGVLNGFAVPSLVAQHADADTETMRVVRVVLDYNHALNAAFARVFMTATPVAVILWSLAILRTRTLPRWLAIFGLVASLAGLAALIGGVLGVDVRRFGIFVFGYSAWAIVAGVTLFRPAPGR